MELAGKIEVTKEPSGFYQSLSMAMAEIPMFEKKNKVSFGKTKYAYIKLEEINAVIKPILKKYDLFITHKVENGFLVTSLVHITSKDGVSSYFKIDSLDPQKIGSLMTYGKRYNICAILNIDCAGEDDDCVSLYNQTLEPEKSADEFVEMIENWLCKQTEERSIKFHDYIKGKYESETLAGLSLTQLKEVSTMIK